MHELITFELNGALVEADVSAHTRLIDLLRNEFGETGTKEGCGEGECGACTVIIDGKAVNSCLYPAGEVEGRKVITIEGLRLKDAKLSVLQQAFVDCGAVQCGFCTPGMIMSAHALLDENPDPTDDDIRAAIIGNLCRCTGYVQIVQAIKTAAVKMKKKDF